MSNLEENKESKEIEDVNEEKKIKKFSYFEPIAGIIFAVVATVIFLGFPEIIAVVFVSGPVIPTFNTEVIRSLWVPIILWAIFRIAIEVFYIVEHRYTKRLAITTLIGNVLALICTLVIFIPVRIVNIEYINWINTHFTDNAEWFGEILVRPNLIIIGIMLIGLILDSITVSVKGFKRKKDEDTDEDDEYDAIKADAVEGIDVEESDVKDLVIE
ncbi:MAG: hypothetical protein FWE83_08260 [Oscillospiraceae bacterium]|nr:hypothetical protein [Oscillospiraceae bacterium]